jgi:two-component sensor histidine kinase
MNFMMRELDHRVKNTLAAVLGICEQTFASSPSTEEFCTAYRGRLLAMARTHESLAAAKWHGARLRELVTSTVGALLPGESGRLVVEGPDVLLPSTAALPIAVTLHELATNAVKYGAWSRPLKPGRIRISWTLDANHTLHLEWQESDGPAVEPPTHSGFGTHLVQGMISHELRGRVDLAFLKTGVNCQITVPNADVPKSVPIPATAMPREAAA